VSLNMVTFLIIIWLFAGNFKKKQSPPTVDNKSVVGTIFSFNLIYSLLKLYRLNGKQSADNSLVLFESNNAEVVFDFSKNLISDDLFISDHLKKHRKPESLEELGYYLAGLIEADGHIRAGEINIAFHMRDASLAYYIKKRIGYGSVWYDKKSNCYYYGVFHKIGREKLLNLINGKLRGPFKIEQLKKHNYDKEFNVVILPPALYNLLDNHWLAGFADADASFIIYFTYSISHKNKLKLKLVFSIFVEKNLDYLLLQIKETFGGYLIKRKNTDNFYYSSGSFLNAKKVIDYFDLFHLNSTKYINYIKWRKTYRIIQRKEHLTIHGINKIRAIKHTGLDNTQNII